ncbi:type II toxin-antitoxin system PemK/MazF family toxin [Lactiplantibacillus plantarum]|uniref:type II toxin-antitoxin system PemK/MazF family toxin n=1 Tax=Lactiplantibacillus plantarum TaxID=1590 RepID=UPI0021A4999F|nr:type II toxin-antitoxin system PemK/MazF family toxin [Lactiplantibacillus plantarum]MCT3223595.1 type II toxin-antitoxin system PemK/MazF family toxin [Lactiplantibacillus plantarum]
MNKNVKKIHDLDIWNAQKKIEALNALNNNIKLNQRHFRAGSIFWADLGENVGYEINKNRPVLILSGEHFNRGTATIAPLTSNGRLNNPDKITNTQFIIYKDDIQQLSLTGNNDMKDKSLVKIEQIRTISAARIGDRIGYISTDQFQKIKLRIRTLFSL